MPGGRSRSGLPRTHGRGQNPETATKFIEALDEANAFYTDPANVDAMLDIREEVSGVSEDQARQIRSKFSTTIPLGVTQSVHDVLVEYGIVAKPEEVKARETIRAESPTSD